jgi:hypothetical protein
MKGIISFHPVDPQLFERFITPLIDGGKIQPDEYLDNAIRLRDNLHQASATVRGIEYHLDSAAPPEAEQDAPFWKKVKTRLDAMEHEVDEAAQILGQILEPDLHLDGRPFFITEESARRVGDLVDEYRNAEDSAQVDDLARDQLIRLDRRLAGAVEPLPGEPPSNSFNYRRELLDDMRALYDLARTARLGGDWPDRTGRRIKAARVVEKELAFRSMQIHSRAVPFWYGRDVDGLETVCRAAGVDPPDCLVPAWPVWANACSEFPALRENLLMELSSSHSVGAYVSPGEISDLLDFLNVAGARIIQEATRQGAGPACTLLLRKIRECAAYAERTGSGYLEAAGLTPPHLDP